MPLLLKIRGDNDTKIRRLMVNIPKENPLAAAGSWQRAARSAAHTALYDILANRQIPESRKRKRKGWKASLIVLHFSLSYLKLRRLYLYPLTGYLAPKFLNLSENREQRTVDRKHLGCGERRGASRAQGGKGKGKGILILMSFHFHFHE